MGGRRRGGRRRGGGIEGGGGEVVWVREREAGDAGWLVEAESIRFDRAVNGSKESSWI